jgi:hypothetical protein
MFRLALMAGVIDEEKASDRKKTGIAGGSDRRGGPKRRGNGYLAAFRWIVGAVFRNRLEIDRSREKRLVSKDEQALQRCPVIPPVIRMWLEENCELMGRSGGFV